MVVDCGLKETRVVPVLDGCILHGAVQRVPVGGHHVTALAEGMLRCEGEMGEVWRLGWGHHATALAEGMLRFAKRE